MHIPLLDNTASFLSGVSQMYQRKGRTDVNLIAFAGDGATADCGFQSLSGAAERNEKMLYICYDNEGYMNTGFQRSSTTSLGSSTSTTPKGQKQSGKKENAKYVPLIMAMHNIDFVATASPSHMADMIAKIQKGLEASKNGFAYLHIFSPCPTGWEYNANESISIARRAVSANVFPLWEKNGSEYKMSITNKEALPISEFIKGIKKYSKMTESDIFDVQEYVDNRMALLLKLCKD